MVHDDSIVRIIVELLSKIIEKKNEMNSNEYKKNWPRIEFLEIILAKRIDIFCLIFESVIIFTRGERKNQPSMVTLALFLILLPILLVNQVHVLQLNVKFVMLL